MAQRDDVLDGTMVQFLSPKGKTVSLRLTWVSALVASVVLLSACYPVGAFDQVNAGDEAAMSNSESPSRAPYHETLVGTFIGPGVTCPQFLTDAGEQVSLSGLTAEMTEGARYVLHGSVARQSKCMQGREIRVASFSAE